MKDSQLIKIAKDLLEGLFEKMDLSPEVKVSVQVDDKDKKFLLAEISGDDLGMLIGTHGRNLNALQLIVGLMLSRQLREKKEEELVRILLDVNDYRKRRESSIRSMAMRAVHQVQESGQDLELNPMSAFERRAVHMALSEVDGVETESVGDGEDRRVVIKTRKETEETEESGEKG